MRTYAELERHAYVTGDKSAGMLAQLDTLERFQESAGSASLHVQEARGCFPAEDCLQSIIQYVQTLARSRVTKADMVELAGMLEELQAAIYQSSEHGMEELNKAEDVLL